MKPQSILAITGHRPWPIPKRPWIMQQAWNNVLFAHWPVEPAELQALIPAPLVLDTCMGHAWITIALFKVTGARPRYLPPMPLISRFLQSNLRTYVVVHDKPGAFFFRLDVSNPVVAAAASYGFRLAFAPAQIQSSRAGDQITYGVQRGPQTFAVTGQPTAAQFTAPPGTLDHWLIERYCLYTTNPSGKLFRGEIHHAPWQVFKATAQVQMHQYGPVALGSAPGLLHYADRQDALIWALTAVSYEKP